MFTKQQTPDRAQAAATLRATIDKAIDVAVAAHVDRRDVASICESAAVALRTSDAIFRPVL